MRYIFNIYGELDGKVCISQTVSVPTAKMLSMAELLFTAS